MTGDHVRGKTGATIGHIRRTTTERGVRFEARTPGGEWFGEYSTHTAAVRALRETDEKE